MAAAIGEQPSVVHCLQGLAEIAGSEGEAVRAAHLWGAAEGLLEQLEAQGLPSSVDSSRSEVRVSAARLALGNEAFQAALAHGKELKLEEAVAEALNC